MKVIPGKQRFAERIAFIVVTAILFGGAIGVKSVINNWWPTEGVLNLLLYLLSAIAFGYIFTALCVIGLRFYLRDTQIPESPPRIPEEFIPNDNMLRTLIGRDPMRWKPYIKEIKRNWQSMERSRCFTGDALNDTPTVPH